jgi:hypothetical protein
MPGAEAVARRLQQQQRLHSTVIADDLRLFLESMLLALATLLPIVNPLGAAPVYLAKTIDLTTQEHVDLARAASRSTASCCCSRRF